MKQKHADYRIVSYPRSRRFMEAARRSVQGKPMMHGLLEVDVSKARAFLREQKAKTGETLSFTAFIIACLAKAVDENKAVQASRKGSKHLVLFEDVDVLTYIEREVAGEKPGVVDGRIALREYLSLTMSFDHDLIDGAPAARLTQRLKELIESGYGLFDPTIESEQTSLSRG